MRGTVVVAVDPGGAETGIAARLRSACLWHTVVTRDALSMGDYIAEILGAIDDAVRYIDSPQDPDPVIAVEALNPPTPQMGTTSVRGLIGTAQVLGAVLARWPDAVVVPPGGHGSAPLAVYPERLRPTRGQGRGHDRLRHARSAFDVAGAAVRLTRLRDRGVTT